MTECSRLLRAAGVCLFVAAAAAGAERHAPARVYTNDDLARVSSRRGETGVESVPAAAATAGVPAATGAVEGRGESYWRGEAARVRHRVDPWRDAAAEL